MPDSTAASARPARDWPFETRQLSPVLGVEILGITMAQAVSPEYFPSVYEAFLDHGIILFGDVELPLETQVAFAANFGEVQAHVRNQYHGYAGRFPEIYWLTNLDADGNPKGVHPDRGTLFWHTDGSWRAKPGLATMMYSEQLPARGGETLFADMYGAYDGLSEEWKARLEGLKAVHNLNWSRNRRAPDNPLKPEQRDEVPPVSHPVVRTHPETGRKAVFLGDHAECIEGMDYAEGRALVEELNGLITGDHLVYRHRWSPRQCAVWDNRRLLHKATEYDTANEKRVMRRCTVHGDKPF
jgi:taurine dioxygenase